MSYEVIIISLRVTAWAMHTRDRSPKPDRRLPTSWRIIRGTSAVFIPLQYQR